jgi:tRNA (guanine37-N1)-methyltransferase
MPKSTVCIKVPKKQGERAIALANKLSLFDKSMEIQRNESNLWIPFIRQPTSEELITLKTQLPEAQLTTDVFMEKQASGQTFMQILENSLPPHLLASLPQALDVVGDIAILEIPREFKPFERQIGETILKTHKNLKTVLAKAGAISGTYRLRDFTFIAGEHKTQTIHREFGCQFHIDVAKAYFSPRLSHEHERVAALVQNGETVVDLFAGVGPFSVLIAKRNLNVRVYAVDINPEAVELLRANVRVNRVENRVFPMLGDARQIAATRLNSSADRVIMNLPETAIEFVDVACQAIKHQGGTIHFYSFVRSPDSIENLKLHFSEAAESAGRKVKEFLVARSVRETAPFESQIVLDAEII